MAYMDNKIIPRSLPADLTVFTAKSRPIRAIKDQPLSKEERRFLAEGIPKTNEPNLVDRKVVEAFGKGCAEMQYSVRVYNRHLGLLIAVGEEEKTAAGRTRFRNFSIAQFQLDPVSKKELVNVSFRAKEVQCDHDIWEIGTRREAVQFDCADGSRLVFGQRK
jgi:hypothetical protein